MGGYYTHKLSAHRLRRCYAIASPRVKQYLEAEIRHVLERLRPQDAVLELGCGYGRVALRLARAAGSVVGIDTSEESLRLARRLAAPGAGCRFLAMDAARLAFSRDAFHVVACVQNGICAFGADPAVLLREALRVTRPGGLVLLSTYSDRFWLPRLEWFEAQADEGLLGPVDRAATGDGVIVCRDGFRSGRMSPDDLRSLCAQVGVEPTLTEVDGSSVFCQVAKR